MRLKTMRMIEPINKKKKMSTSMRFKNSRLRRQNLIQESTKASWALWRKKEQMKNHLLKAWNKSMRRWTWVTLSCWKQRCYLISTKACARSSYFPTKHLKFYQKCTRYLNSPIWCYPVRGRSKNILANNCQKNLKTNLRLLFKRITIMVRPHQHNAT